MKWLLLLLILPLCACQSDKFAQSVTTLVDHGCKGTLDVSGQAGTATGLTPGQASITGHFSATCDKSNVAPPAP